LASPKSEDLTVPDIRLAYEEAWFWASACGAALDQALGLAEQ